MRRVLLLVTGGSVIIAGLVWWLGTRAAQVDPTPAPIRLADLAADILELNASAVTKRGPGRAVALRFDQAMEFVPHHIGSTDIGGVQPIEVWAEHLGAAVVFNAGQFDEKLNHLGWLKSRGKWLAAQPKNQWKGLLVSGPLEGQPWAGIVDLASAAPTIVDRYQHALQSMMLVDDRAQLRVRDTERAACRTVVAQDQQGRMLVVVTEGAVTLADLARWLPETNLHVARAMNLDGGIESQLYVNTPERRLVLYGQYGTGTTVFERGVGQIRYPIPAVVAVWPPARAPASP